MQESEEGKAATAVTPRAEPAFARVLCAIDGKDGGFEAVRQAAALAAPGGELTLLLVTSWRNIGHLAPAIGAIDAHAAVKRAESIAAEAGVRSTIEVDPAAPPARAVLDWASGHDLLAIGAPASSWLGGLVITGVGDGAVGELPIPVLTARAPSSDDVCRHVLVASDALADSVHPTAVGGALAASRGTRLTLLHALSHRPPRDAKELVLAQAEWLRERGVPRPDLVLRHGRAHEVILDVAERLGASLIVQGSRRRAGLRALGSVSRRVVHEAGCSVLTVPPEMELPEP